MKSHKVHRNGFLLQVKNCLIFNVIFGHETVQTKNDLGKILKCESFSAVYCNV